VLDLCRALRAEFAAPIVLFGYYNPLLAFGLNGVARAAAQAGADGFLVVDLPPEEADDLHAAGRAQGLDLIYLLAPTSTDARVARVRARASGFVYYVSMTGVTGHRIEALDDVRRDLARVKAAIPLPVCVGFGVTTPDDASALAPAADGVVVGSAFVRRCEEHAGDPARLATEIESFARALKGAMRSP
jgi:tryptophan synthase alpha chain